ncbi:hypothetical protein Tsubulata_030216 [Turnera subulata]|uniref:AAA+ ATPase domain-containing protein n=1 Tax=Turnera subulata TaxID=218843 RepID=A0A9Q0G502_9ROSI|nr:hypothetical protein Tsubulata_030216 [Turnera subulata]
MGKRNTTVILSSDDDDSDYTLRSSRSYSKPKSKPLVTRTNPRQPKRRRVTSSGSCLGRESSNVNEVQLNLFRFPNEDFEELFSGYKVSAGAGRSNLKELWVDKYKPQSVDELAVHKKKVEEVKVWFEDRLKSSKDGYINHVLLATGPAGSGKSTTIHVIASHFGARLCEWNTPTPTLWQEHMHNSSAGVQYISKLDEFINFTDKIRKYGLITSSHTSEPKGPVVLLIDDLPVLNGRVALERLQNCLLLLVRSTRTPTAIVLTDYGKMEPADSSGRYLEDLLLVLESAGACKVAFNPITNNSIKKTLTRICRQEQCSVTTEQVDLIAKASGGDIRHAVTSLQLFCVKPDPMSSTLLYKSTPHFSDGKEDEINALISGFSSLFGRDETLSLFHALGKFLHNKRETEVSTASDQDGFVMREKFCRLPLKMDAPEIVLCQAHGQARPVADFLHENGKSYLPHAHSLEADMPLPSCSLPHDEAMDDASDVASYLSDTDLLLSSFRGMLTRYNEAESVLQSAGASVAVRGVLFGNSHPSPSRWHAIRRPKLWQVEQSMLRNQRELAKQRHISYGESCSFYVSNVATEYAPVLKWLGNRTTVSEDTQSIALSNKTDDGISARMDVDVKDSEISEDEIEDW